MSNTPARHAARKLEARPTGRSAASWSPSGYPRLVVPALAVALVALGVGVCLVRGVPYSLDGIRMAAGVDVTVLLALANLGVFAWHTRALWRMTVVTEKP